MVTARATANSTSRRLSNLDQLMLWGLMLGALYEVIRRFLEGRVGVTDFVLVAIYLVCAALVWTGWRWIFLAPLVVIALAVFGGLAADGLSPLVNPATHWADFEQWIIELPLLGLFIFAGVAKLVQLIRKQTLHLPAFTPYIISAVVGLAIGGNLIAILNR
jgi:hypothetical protein